MKSLYTRIGMTGAAVSALIGVLTLPTDRKLGMLMVFFAILATSHTFLRAGLASKENSAAPLSSSDSGR